MSPTLFEVLGWIAGIFFVLTITFSVMLIFILVVNHKHAEDAEQEIEKK